MYRQTSGQIPVPAVSTDNLTVAMLESWLREENPGRISELFRKANTVETATYGEIAQLLGWPLGTVQARVHRARLEVRAFLRNRGVVK